MKPEPFHKVATSPATITLPKVGKVQPPPLKVKYRFERKNPKTKENPNGDPKVFVVVEDGSVFILCGEKRDQWHRLSETPPSIAKLMEK